MLGQLLYIVVSIFVVKVITGKRSSKTETPREGCLGWSVSLSILNGLVYYQVENQDLQGELTTPSSLSRARRRTLEFGAAGRILQTEFSGKDIIHRPLFREFDRLVESVFVISVRKSDSDPSLFDHDGLWMLESS